MPQNITMDCVGSLNPDTSEFDFHFFDFVIISTLCLGIFFLSTSWHFNPYWGALMISTFFIALRFDEYLVTITLSGHIALTAILGRLLDLDILFTTSAVFIYLFSYSSILSYLKSKFGTHEFASGQITSTIPFLIAIVIAYFSQGYTHQLLLVFLGFMSYPISVGFKKSAHLEPQKLISFTLYPLLGYYIGIKIGLAIPLAITAFLLIFLLDCYFSLSLLKHQIIVYDKIVHENNIDPNNCPEDIKKAIMNEINLFKLPEFNNEVRQD